MNHWHLFIHAYWQCRNAEFIALRSQSSAVLDDAL